MCCNLVDFRIRGPAPPPAMQGPKPPSLPHPFHSFEERKMRKRPGFLFLPFFPCLPSFLLFYFHSFLEVFSFSPLHWRHVSERNSIYNIFLGGEGRAPLRRPLQPLARRVSKLHKWARRSGGGVSFLTPKRGNSFSPAERGRDKIMAPTDGLIFKGFFALCTFLHFFGSQGRRNKPYFTT